MPMTANKFLFERDFRNPDSNAKNAAALQAAEERGLQRGRAEGRMQAQAEAESHLTNAVKRLADAATSMLAGIDAHHASLEEEAIAFGTTLGRKLAGAALAGRALETIAATARTSFQHLRGVPHLVVRVNEALVEQVDGLIHRIARERGYEGRLVVMGEPGIAPGDARIEWADGGVIRDQNQIEDAVTRALEGVVFY
jgi:flagellar assembly protein FliH